MKLFNVYLKNFKLFTNYLKRFWSKFYVWTSQVLKLHKSRIPKGPDTFNNFNPVITYEQLRKLLIAHTEPAPITLQRFLSNIFNESKVHFSSMPSSGYVPIPKYASESDKINFILSYHLGIGSTILSVNSSIYSYYCLAYEVLNIYNHRMPFHFETAFRFYYKHFKPQTYEFNFH